MRKIVLLHKKSKKEAKSTKYKIKIRKLSIAELMLPSRGRMEFRATQRTRQINELRPFLTASRGHLGSITNKAFHRRNFTVIGHWYRNAINRNYRFHELLPPEIVRYRGHDILPQIRSHDGIPGQFRNSRDCSIPRHTVYREIQNHISYCTVTHVKYRDCRELHSFVGQG